MFLLCTNLLFAVLVPWDRMQYTGVTFATQPSNGIETRDSIPVVNAEHECSTDSRMHASALISFYHQ